PLLGGGNAALRRYAQARPDQRRNVSAARARPFRVQLFRQRCVERLHGLGIRVIGGDLTGFGGLQVLRRINREVRLGAAVLAVVKPPLEPAVSRLAARFRPSVRIVEFEEAYAVSRAERLENALRLGVGGARAFDRKEVPDGGRYVDRLRRERNQEIRKVEPVFQEIDEILLGILRTGAIPQFLPGGQITGRSGRSQPGLERPQIRRLG